MFTYEYCLRVIKTIKIYDYHNDCIRLPTATDLPLFTTQYNLIVHQA